MPLPNRTSTITPGLYGSYADERSYQATPGDMYPGNDDKYKRWERERMARPAPAPRSHWTQTDDPSKWQSTPIQNQGGQQPAQAVYDPAAASQQAGPWAAPQQPQQQQTPAANPQGQMLTGTAQTAPQQAPPASSMAGHPFYDPNQDYSVPGWSSNQFDPESLAFMNWATNESPEGYYFSLLNQMGLGGMDAKSQAAQAMYRDFARGYQAAKTRNTELWFPQYLAMMNIPWQVDQLSNEQLGINQNAYNGQDRWAIRGY